MDRHKHGCLCLGCGVAFGIYLREMQEERRRAERAAQQRDNPQPWHGPDRDRDPWEPRPWEGRQP